jgi:hypothetical protein
VVEVDDSGQVVGLLGDKEITLSASTGYTAPQPRVVSVSPANGQSGVSLNAPVVAEFNQPLDPSTVTSGNFSITKALVSVSGTLTLSEGVNGPNTIVLLPCQPLFPRSYSVYIGTGIKSSSGNPLLQYSSTSFSTGIVLTDGVAPSVLRVNPSDGVTSVATNSTVSVEFSEPVSPLTLNSSTFKLIASGTEVSGKVERLGLTYFRFVPDDLLLPDTQYQVRIDTLVEDTAGNVMVSAFASTFTTQTGMDNYQPAVTNISPSNGTIGNFINSCYDHFCSHGSYYANGANGYIKIRGVKVPSTITLSAVYR